MAARSLSAPTLPEAMARIRAEFGPGATVTGWRQVRGGIEMDVEVPDAKLLRQPAVLSTAPPDSLPVLRATPAPVLEDQSEFEAWNSVVPARPGKPRAPRHDVFGAPAEPPPRPRGGARQLVGNKPPAAATKPGPAATRRPGLTPRQLELIRLGLPATALKDWTEIAKGPDSVRALEAALAARVPLGPQPDIPWRPVALAGGPGTGKTVMAAKLAARALQSGANVTLIGTDTERTGACAQLEGLAMRLGARFCEAASLALATRLASQALDEGEVVLIDTPAAAHLSAPDIRLSARLATDTGADLMACLPCDGRADDLADAARIWREAGAVAAILTRSDLTARRLGALEALGSAGLPLAWIGTGPWVAGALQSPQHNLIARDLVVPARDAA